MVPGGETTCVCVGGCTQSNRSCSRSETEKEQSWGLTQRQGQRRQRNEKGGWRDGWLGFWRGKEQDPQKGEITG